MIFHKQEQQINKPSGRYPFPISCCDRVVLHQYNSMTSVEDDNESTTHPKPTSLVVTGFGPFGGVEENPSTILVKELPVHLSNATTADATTADAWKQELATCIDQWIICETSAKGVCQTLDALVEAFGTQDEEDEPESSSSSNNTVLLHLGVNVQGTGYQMEECAYNEATFRIPDQQGYRPHKVPIIDGAPVGKRCDTTLNVKALVQHQTAAFPNVETKTSTNPGRFVCNYLYCYSLNKLQTSASTSSLVSVSSPPKKKKKVQCLFLHIPSFETVPKEVQMDYILELMRQLAQISRKEGPRKKNLRG
jgi:pyroglutamyl-peptidase